MSSESTLILFGFLTIITPFLGLPSSWYGYIFFVLGIVVLGIGMLLRMRKHQKSDTSTSGYSADTSSNTDTDTATETATPHDPSPVA